MKWLQQARDLLILETEKKVKTFEIGKATEIQTANKQIRKYEDKLDKYDSKLQSNRRNSRSLSQDMLQKMEKNPI